MSVEAIATAARATLSKLTAAMILFMVSRIFLGLLAACRAKKGSKWPPRLLNYQFRRKVSTFQVVAGSTKPHKKVIAILRFVVDHTTAISIKNYISIVTTMNASTTLLSLAKSSGRCPPSLIGEGRIIEGSRFEATLLHALDGQGEC